MRPRALSRSSSSPCRFAPSRCRAAPYERAYINCRLRASTTRLLRCLYGVFYVVQAYSSMRPRALSRSSSSPCRFAPSRCRAAPYERAYINCRLRASTMRLLMYARSHALVYVTFYIFFINCASTRSVLHKSVNHANRTPFSRSARCPSFIPARYAPRLFVLVPPWDM